MFKACLACTLLASGLAHADRDNDYPLDHSRLEGGLGVRLGSFLVDNVPAGGTVSGHLDVGLRANRWFLYGEYDLMSVSYPVADATARTTVDAGNGSGLVHRLGANARWTYQRFCTSDSRCNEGGDLYAEAGDGVEAIRWDAGGTWTRPDLALGVGLAWWGAADDRHGGLAFGMRFTFARRNDVDHAPAACGGPCETATTPTGWDRGVLFDVTLMFGR